MSYSKTILCLANSRKPPSGRCVAGKEVLGQDYGNWIRPVSARHGHEISEEERRYEDGKKAQVLDVVAIPMLEPQPMTYQSENHLIDDGFYWSVVRKGTWNDVVSAVEPVAGPLWVNGHSTFHGVNDKVPEHIAHGLNSSLMLIRVPKLFIDVVLESGYEGRPGRRRVRGAFSVAGHNYSIVVTDPVVEDEYFVRENGRYPVEDAVLSMSLSELIYGHSHKLIAAVLTRERCEGNS